MTWASQPPADKQLAVAGLRASGVTLPPYLSVRAPRAATVQVFVKSDTFSTSAEQLLAGACLNEQPTPRAVRLWRRSNAAAGADQPLFGIKRLVLQVRLASKTDRLCAPQGIVRTQTRPRKRPALSIYLCKAGCALQISMTPQVRDHASVCFCAGCAPASRHPALKSGRGVPQPVKPTARHV